VSDRPDLRVDRPSHRHPDRPRRRSVFESAFDAVVVFVALAGRLRLGRSLSETTTLFRRRREAAGMADDSDESQPDDASETESEDKSFSERVDEIRQERGEGGEGGEGGRGPPEEMMGGGGPGGGMGGNPFAQMMGGMMGGGGPGGGMGGGPGGGGDVGNEELTREVRQLRDEVHDIRRTLERIADAIED
jgi:hypothetical protein